MKRYIAKSFEGFLRWAREIISTRALPYTKIHESSDDALPLNYSKSP